MPPQSSDFIGISLIAGKAMIECHPFPADSMCPETVMVRPEFMGICRADIKEMRGARDIPSDRGPLFGHELVGPIITAGADTGFSCGDIVTFNPNITPCRTTGFAEYFFIRGSRSVLSESLVVVPRFARTGGAWMPEPFACIVHAVDMLKRFLDVGELTGKQIGIIAAGCAGLMFAMCCRDAGADVIVFNRGEMRRRFARERRLLSDGENRSLSDLAQHHHFFDVVIVAPTIVDAPILHAVEASLKHQGLVFIYGGTRSGQTFPSTSIDIDVIRRNELAIPASVGGKDIIIAGAYGCSKDDYIAGFELRRNRPEQFPLPALVSRTISFSDFPHLANAMADGKEDVPGKVVVIGPSSEHGIGTSFSST